MLRTLLPVLFFYGCMQAQTPLPPTGLIATGYEQHVELSWTPSTSPNVGGYQVWRSADGVQYELLKSTAATATRFIDWTGDEGQNLSRFYALKTVASNGQTSDFSEKKNALTRPMTDEELLEMVQQQTFRYFWDFGHPTSGMARERNNGNGDIVTTGGTGFGIMAIVAGAQRGWVTREAAVNRMIQIASFLQVADRFHGAFPHWMDGNTGNVVSFSQYDDGGDLVETAFLIEGLLAARQYFDQNTPLEKALRGVITGLWEGVEWDWYRRNNSGVLYWHWSPKYAWQMNFPLRGFHEAQIVYILAAASPKHPVPGSLYQTGWTSSNYANTSIHYGQKVYCGPFGGGPMFFAHYSYLGFDPRGWKDAYCNYFIRNRNQALIQQAYSATVPPKHKGYSADCWGLTSCDGPDGYAAHSIYPTDDNGTIAPTAALASMPYTPEASMAALRYFYRTQGERLWGIYGFYDAFNLDKNWFAPSYLAIDQGPIVAMIENHRTGLLWKLFMQNPEIAPALQAMGFTPDNSVGTEDNFLEKQGFDCRVFPNPVSSDGLLNVEFALLRGQKISATLLDVQGRVVQVLFQEKAMPQGITTQSFALAHLPKGVLALEIANEKGEKVVRKVVVY